MKLPHPLSTTASGGKIIDRITLITDMAKCYLTGKTTVTGNKRSHALNATRRTWKANLQTVHIKDENGNVKKVKISARALKKAKIERA